MYCVMIFIDKLSDWSLCVCMVRWVRRSSRSACWGSGWTAVLRRAGFWWPCRKAREGGTTRSSLKWWRNGWTVIGSLLLVPLFQMERRKKRTKTSEDKQSVTLDTTTRPSCVRSPHIRKHKHTPLAPTERQTQGFLFFWFLSLIQQIIWVRCKIKECNHDCICLYSVCSLLLVVFCLKFCHCNACSDLRARRE